jgi:hypothetical protein
MSSLRVRRDGRLVIDLVSLIIGDLETLKIESELMLVVVVSAEQKLILCFHLVVLEFLFDPHECLRITGIASIGETIKLTHDYSSV